MFLERGALFKTKERGSINLELALMTAVLVMAVATPVNFLGSKISDIYLQGAKITEENSPDTILNASVSKDLKYQQANIILNVTWGEKSTNKGTIYTFQYDTNQNFTNPRTKIVQATDLKTTIPISTIYTFARVKATNESGIVSEWINLGNGFKSNPTVIFKDEFSQYWISGNTQSGEYRYYGLKTTTTQFFYYGFGTNIGNNTLEFKGTNGYLFHSLIFSLENNYDDPNSTVSAKWVVIPTKTSATGTGLILAKSTKCTNSNKDTSTPAEGYGAYFYGNGTVAINYWHDNGVSTVLKSTTGIPIKDGSIIAFRKMGTTYQAIVDGRIAVEVNNSAIDTVSIYGINSLGPDDPTYSWVNNNQWDDLTIYPSSTYSGI